MVTEYDLDNTWSTLVTAFIKEQLSTYSVPPDSLLNYISVIPVTYGKRTTQRTIQDPDTIVHVSREFDPHRTKKITLTQNLDLANISDSFIVPRAMMASDPQGTRIHVRDMGSIFRNGIEKLFIEGATVNVVTRGVADYPSGTAGTINRPEIAYVSTTAGDWDTTANIRTDFINSVGGLIVKRFYESHLILAPTLVKPMLSEVIANTATPISQWMTSSIGLPIAYSPFVHEAATKDVFNLYLIDTSRVHIGLSVVMMDAYYDNKSHAYYWDWEVYAVPMFDPLFDGTEYLKGVAQLAARDWDDP